MTKPSRTARVDLEHVDGIPWWEAPIPRRWHKCKRQTTGWLDSGFVDRCACGAISGFGARGIWFDRNSRKKSA